MPSPSLSVIVPALRAADSIGPCLESLLGQDWPAQDVEVIVVDNGSTDETVAIARRYPVRVELEPRRGRSRARNLGARLAQGRFLAFIDVDCEAPKNWLSASVAALNRPWIGAVQARVQKPGFPAQSMVFGQAHYYRPFLDTCAMVTTTEAYKNARGFDEELRRAVDMDYSFRLLSCGYAFRWLPDVVMIKHHDLNSRQIVRRGWDGGKSISVLARKWRALTPQSPARLWRDRIMTWSRSLAHDARHPRSGGKNAMEHTVKIVAAALTDLSGPQVTSERYERATRVHEVFGEHCSLVLSASDGVVFDARDQRAHRLDRAQSLAVIGLVDGTDDAELLAELERAGVSAAAAKNAIDSARILAGRLRRGD
jgi:glycosyltransferase involved in cell wall biosynthesis